MRDVNLDLGIPGKDALLARIERPERFRPEPRLAKPLRYTVGADGFGELHVEKTGANLRVHPILLETYRCLEEGAPFAEMVRRAEPLWERENKKVVERHLRGHLWLLHRAGYVDLAFEEPPASFEDGRYVRLKEIGRGGMGIVHLCEDTREKRRVVVKHAWGWSKSIERAEGSIRREAAIHARFSHPGIPPLYGTFEREGLLHIVRAYAEGVPLHALRDEMARATTAERMRVGAQVADVVQHIHDRGFLYLDAKPENFILDRATGALQVLDLGICRPHAEGASTLRTPVGSRGYAAPETVHERVATLRSDVFGVGRVLFRLATGVDPRQSWGSADLAERLGGVPEAERALILRMCATAPAERPATLADAARAMRSVAGA